MATSRRARHTPTRAQILHALDEIFAGPAWHGPSVRQALRRQSPRAAARRVAGANLTAWELLLHLSAARHELLTRVTGASPGRFPRPRRSPWWVRLPEHPDAAQWEADVALLEDYQRRLLAAVRAAPASRFKLVYPGRRRTIDHELLGIAFHDAYHAGQMVLLAKLAKQR